MSGIVNSTGAKSGVIGTTVGTASSNFTGFHGSGLLVNTIVSGEAMLFPTTRIDREDGATATNFATGTGIYTCPKAGYYSVDLTIQGKPGTSTTSSIGMNIFMGNAGGLFNSGNAMQGSVAIGYGLATANRVSANLLGTWLAAVDDYFLCKSSLENTQSNASTHCITLEMINIVYLGT